MAKRVRVGSMVLAAIVSSCMGSVAIEDPVALDPAVAIAEANRLFDRWSSPFDFDAYEASLGGAIEQWEGALTALPESDVQSRSRVLNRLAQAYFELADGYLGESADRETAYEAGKDAALASLRLDPDFVATETRDGFRAALRSANDPEAIFWYGNALGQWLNYHRLTAIMGGVRDVHASFERALELDEAYDGAGPHRALGSLIAQAYFVIGRTRDDAVAHFARCIELAPHHLEAYVSYAVQYARPTGDRALFDELVGTALTLAEDPTVMAAFPFYNHLSLARARALVRDD